MSRYRERYSASPPRRRDYYEADIRIDPEDGYGPYRPRRRDSSITRPQRAAKVQKLNNRTRFITQTRPNASHSYGALDDQYEVPLPSSRYELRREYKQRSPGERLMRRASPEKYVREIIADESDLDFDSGSEARSEASFVLDIPGQDAAMDENTDPLYSTSFGSQVQEKPRRSDQGSYTETVHKVLRSRWLGDGRASDAVAELTAGHGQISSLKTDSQFDMRWIHLESQCPSFDYFVDYVQKIPGLNEDLKQDTIALLEQSRNHELPIYTSEGPRGKHFESFLDQELVARAKKKDTEKRIQLLCLPYFSLASYSGYNLPKMSTLHPTQTLLQYSSASTTRKRELDQAVCKLSHTTKGHCFHIPKIWCLILDSELLLTCSHLPISEVVERDLIKIKPLPTLQSNAAEPVLSISDAGGRVWKLPAKDCKSWFQLTSRFWPLDSTQSFDDRYSLFNEGSLVDSSNWADIISQKHPRLNLIIRRKKNQSYTEPRRRGSFSASDSETERAEQDSELPSSFASAVASFIAIQDRPFRARGSSSERRKSLFDDVAINAPSASPYISATVINEVQTTLKEFHYFLWINAVPVQLEDQNSKSLGSSRPPRMFNVRMDELAKMFGSMQSFLDKSSSIKRSAFRACPSESFNLVQTYLDEIRRYGEELKRRDEEVRRREEQVRRLNEEAKRKEEEERRQVEELRRRKEEARRREEKRKAESRESSELQSRTRSRSRPRSSRSLPRSPDDMRVTRHVSHRRSDYTEPEIIELPRAERVYVETEYVRRPQYGPSPRKVARMKRAFCNTMLKCFTFYFPVNFKSHLIDKYWGAMFSLLKQNDRDFLDFYRIFDVSYSRILGRIEDLLDKLARALSDGKGPLPWDISLPKEFGNAWLHLLSFIVLCAVDTKKIDDDNTRKELSRFDELFRKGLKLLARNLGVQFLSGKQAVLPFGLVSVITATLLRDVTSGQPDISSTYYDYMKNLEQEIQINPYNRSHQEKIAYLRQEIDVVLKVLAEQLQCVSALQAGPRQELLEAPDKVREFYILQDCLALIKAKTQSFQEMEMVATQLGIYNIRRIESNKDRQEAAILVFTIVTIIFLPLSFVSSFFGMNTVDIRDMGSSQWLFWAVGIPVTVIVVGLSLVFAHKIEPTREWWGRVKNRFSSAKIQPVFIEKQTLDDMYRTNSIVAGAGAAAAAAAAPYSRIVEPMGGRTVLEDDLYAARSRVMREMERDNEFSGPTRHLEREGMPYAMRYPELPRRRQPYGPGPLRRPSPPPGYSRPPPPPPPPLVRVPRSPSRFR